MQNELLNTTGKRLRALREARGMSQIDLASRLCDLGVTIGNSWISRLESQDDKLSPSVEVLVAIARVLGTSTDFLLLLTDRPEPHLNGITTSESEPAHVA